MFLPDYLGKLGWTIFAGQDKISHESVPPGTGLGWDEGQAD